MSSQMPNLLCVDDEPLVLNTLERLFRDQYNVFKAENGAAGVQILKERPVDVIISDQRMPGMTGVQLLQQARTLSPNSMRILLTGYADLEAVRDAVNAGEVFRYLTKPWSNSVLKDAVRIGLSAARASAEAIPAAKSTNTTNAAVSGGVLLLDSDPNVMEEIKQHINLPIRACKSLEEAIAELERDPSIAVVLAEIKLNGGQDSTEFVGALKAANPAVVTIALSRLNDAAAIIKLINGGQIFRFLAKPASSERLRDAVHQGMIRHQQLVRNPALQKRYVVPQSTETAGFAVPAAAGQPVASQSGTAEPDSNGMLGRLFRLFRR